MLEVSNTKEKQGCNSVRLWVVRSSSHATHRFCLRRFRVCSRVVVVTVVALAVAAMITFCLQNVVLLDESREKLFRFFAVRERYTRLKVSLNILDAQQSKACDLFPLTVVDGDGDLVAQAFDLLRELPVL